MMRSVPVVGAPPPWPPPPSPSTTLSSNTTTDNKTPCTPGICSFTCPQFCPYLLQQPPPSPFYLDPSMVNSDDQDSSSSGKISPLMAALIAVLAAAFLLLFYYTVVSRLCLRRQRRRTRNTSQILHTPEEMEDGLEVRLDPMVARSIPAGLDENFIRQITVFRYRRADGLVEGTECAVCLNEFGEGESLRLMPNCEHAFHIPCIDTWLKTQSSCPMCRATMDPIPARPGPSPSTNGAVSVSVAAMQVQSSNDVVLVVREVHGGDDEVVVVCHDDESQSDDDSESESSNGEGEVRKGGVNQRL